jgi:predicted acylesterase/phospholipase RssA
VTDAQPHSIEHIDLALSGGGFRATLFHLGVIGFLQSQGLLEKVRTICSVSGGSILAAHMVTRWPEYTSNNQEDFIKAVEHLIRAIQHDDISLRALLRFQSAYRVLLRRALDSERLVDEYRRILGPTNNNVNDAGQSPAPQPITRWDDLNRLTYPIPEVQILATHLNTATMCGFNRNGFFISSNRNDSDESVKAWVKFAEAVKTGGEEIARAVAASSAFPPIFAPLPVIKGEQNNLHLLTDGGVYDNSGVNRLRELYNKNGWTDARDRLVLVSDAGRAFSVVVGQRFDTIIEYGSRVTDAQANSTAESETEQAQAFFKAHDIPVLRCSIHEILKGAAAPVNHSSPLQQKLGAIRTELDKFSDVEAFALYRHGFLVARHQYLTKLTTPVSEQASESQSWYPHKPTLINRPREEFEKALKSSHEMKKVAWLRRIAIPVAAIALGVVLVVGALMGAALGWTFARERRGEKVDSGSAYTVSWIDRMELPMRDGEFVTVNERRWPRAYGSGLVFNGEENGKYVFYMITDRGPAFQGPNTADGKTFKLYLQPDYAPHIARVQLDKNGNPPEIEKSFELHYGRTATSGLPPKEQSGNELTAEYDENNEFPVLQPRRFGVDPEDVAVDSNGAFWISEEYRPAVMKAVQTEQTVVEIQPNLLLPEHGLPAEFKNPRPNRGIESISIKDGYLFIALQGALLDKDPNKDGSILIARTLLSEAEQFVNDGRTQPKWEIYKYAIRDFYKNPATECSIGAIHAIDKDHLLVLEREVKVQSRQAMITIVSLEGVPSGSLVTPVPVVDLALAKWVSEKPEGMTAIDDKTIVISSDNDFGMLLEGMIDITIEDDSSHKSATSQLPTTNMDFFKTEAGPDGKYRLKCKIGGFKDHALKLRPQERADERRPVFWVIHLKDPLLPVRKN